LANPNQKTSHEHTVFCLIVEDEPLAQQVLENYIQRMPELKIVTQCESVEAAFEALTTNKVDLIFLDLNLEATSSVELINKIQTSRNSRYYIVITTATTRITFNPQTIFNSPKVRLIDYLTKPFSFEQFHTAVQKVLVAINKDQATL
jgi:two-component system LytT family response regulator